MTQNSRVMNWNFLVILIRSFGSLQTFLPPENAISGKFRKKIEVSLIIRFCCQKLTKKVFGLNRKLLDKKLESPSCVKKESRSVSAHFLRHVFKIDKERSKQPKITRNSSSSRWTAYRKVSLLSRKLRHFGNCVQYWGFKIDKKMFTKGSFSSSVRNKTYCENFGHNSW